MKKFLLSAFAILSLTGIGTAQTFQTISGDTVTKASTGTGDQVKVYNLIKNISSSDLAVKWKISSYNFPTGWTFEGVCDNVICYSSQNTLAGSYQVTSIISAGATISDFHAVLTDDAAPNGSSCWVRTELNDTVNHYTKYATFVATKGITGVTTVTRSDDEIVLYPNPARSAVNIIFDQNSGVKNIAIYNLIGKVVSVYRVSGNSAKLDVDALPSGIYFVRLTDGEGRIVATRKFTHQ